MESMDQIIENGNNTVLVADGSMEAPKEHFSPTDTNSLPRFNRVIGFIMFNLFLVYYSYISVKHPQK